MRAARRYPRIAHDDSWTPGWQRGIVDDVDGRENAQLRLRAHHLLCILTYVGRGYSPRFVATMDAVVARIGAGEAFALVDGPDSLCDALEPASDDAAHCRAPHNRDRDAVALRHVESALGRELASPVTLSATDLGVLREAFASGALRPSCEGCEWKPLCDDVSAARFADSRLLQIGRARA